MRNKLNVFEAEDNFINSTDSSTEFNNSNNCSNCSNADNSTMNNNQTDNMTE